MENNEKVNILIENQILLVKNIFWEYESPKAVKFWRKSDLNFFWIPKSQINGKWSKDKDFPQNITLNYKMDLFWKERGKIAKIRFDRGEKLRKLGYTKSREKAYLYYKKINTGRIYTDLRGTSMLSFKKDTRTLVYYYPQGPEHFTLFMKEVVLLARNDCQPRGSFFDTQEIDGYFTTLDLGMPDGYCVKCGRDILHEVEWDCLLIDWLDLEAQGRDNKYSIYLCNECKKLINQQKFDQLYNSWIENQEVSFQEFLQIFF